jgi:hypothetical protein
MAAKKRGRHKNNPDSESGLRLLRLMAAIIRIRFRRPAPIITSAFRLHNFNFASALWHRRRNLYRPWWPFFLSHESPVNIDKKGCRGPSCQVCILDKSIKTGLFFHDRAMDFVFFFLYPVLSGFIRGSRV